MDVFAEVPSLTLRIALRIAARPKAFFMVVWRIPGDDAALLHAGTVSIEGKLSGAAIPTDQAWCATLPGGRTI